MILHDVEMGTIGVIPNYLTALDLRGDKVLNYIFPSVVWLGSLLLEAPFPFKSFSSIHTLSLIYLAHSGNLSVLQHSIRAVYFGQLKEVSGS